MSDEIIVMSKGNIEQTGAPLEIYSQPVNKYVSNFIGVANLLDGHISKITTPGNGEATVNYGDMTANLPCKIGVGINEGDETTISIRPENVHAVREKTDGNCIEGRVENAIFLGNHVDCRVSWGDFEWKVIAHPRDQLKAGDKIFLRFDSEHTLAVQ